MLQPEEAVLIAFILSILVEALEDKTLVLGIEFRRNQVEYLLDIQFIIRIVLGYILLIKLNNLLLYRQHIPQVITFKILADRCRHTPYNQVEPEQFHHLVVDESINRCPFLPGIF